MSRIKLISTFHVYTNKITGTYVTAKYKENVAFDRRKNKNV